MTTARADARGVGARPARRAAQQSGVARWWLPSWRLQTDDLVTCAAPAVVFGVSLVGIGVGVCVLASNAADEWALPALFALAMALGLLVVHAYSFTRSIDPLLVVLVGCCVVAVAVVGGLPMFFILPHVFYAIFHRSVADAVLLFGLGVPSASFALYYLLGCTPRASDVSRYPLLLTPVMLGLGTYAVLVANLLVQAWQQFSAKTTDGHVGWIVLTRAFQVRVAPPAVGHFGLLFNLLGTLELVVLTLVVGVPIGVGVGVFVSEVAPGPLGRVVRFCTTALRGISVVLFALAGASLVALSRGTGLERFVGGFFVENIGANIGAEMVGAINSRGSYLPAALVTAMLVIPVVARATEEGCRSLPRGIREGSAALGATPDYALVRLVVPWAFPNIVTSMLIGAAETAGGVSTLLFLAGSGEHGVSPLNEVTSLAYIVFSAQFSTVQTTIRWEHPYQFAAMALLLVVALTFTMLALALKARYASRYRGA